MKEDTYGFKHLSVDELSYSSQFLRQMEYEELVEFTRIVTARLVQYQEMLRNSRWQQKHQ